MVKGSGLVEGSGLVAESGSFKGSGLVEGSGLVGGSGSVALWKAAVRSRMGNCWLRAGVENIGFQGGWSSQKRKNPSWFLRLGCIVGLCFPVPQCYSPQ